jgi:hypothetical protein
MAPFFASAYAGLFAYVGPDTFLPVTSLVSVLAGMVLMAWGIGWRSLLRLLPLPARRRGPSNAPAPHLAWRASAGARAQTAASTSAQDEP